MTEDRIEEVLEEIEQRAEREFLPIIGRVKGRVLRRVIHQFNPKRILEVGTLIGYSVILMAKELEADAEIITIEVSPREAKIAEKNIARSRVEPRVSVLVGNAIDILLNIHGEFDLVFIDADKEEYLDYLRLIEGKIHRGSVVVADNTGICSKHMRAYLEYVRTSGGFRSSFVPIGQDGLEVSVKL